MAYENMSFAVGFNAEYGGIQNSLFQVQKKLDKTMEALATGKRVNEMMDDEGGMAIADTMSSWKSGTDQSIYNLKEFITMTKVAEKALNDIQDILFQMKQTVDRLNGIETATDRSAAQSQLTELASAINKIAVHTEYKGFKLFNIAQEGNNNTYLEHTVNAGVRGGMLQHSDRYIRYGAGAEDFLSWNLGIDPRAGQLGMVLGHTISLSSGNIDSYYFNGKNIKEIADQQGIDLNTNEGKITAIRQALGENVKVDIISGLSSTAATTGTRILIQTPGDFIYQSAASASSIWVRAVKFDTYENEFVNAGNNTVRAGGNVILGTNEVTGQAIQGSQDDTATAILGDRAQALYLTNNTVGDLTHNTAGAFAADEGLFDVNVLSNENAALARVQIEAAIIQIDELRGVLSAMQHQAESLINQRMEESVAAEAQISYIMDTDYAKELANFTKDQISQQAGVNMLSQKRQMAQLVQQLLR